MGDVLRVAAIQMTSGADPGANRATAERLIARAAERGSRLVVLPEKWHLIADAAAAIASAEDLAGPSLAAAAGWARRHGIALVAGSVIERDPAGGAPFNTTVVLDPAGAPVAAYRKLHLFDVEVGGVAYRESAAAQAGAELVTADVLDRRLGLSICYDLRFPEVYRGLTLAGATILTIPAAFTATTGRAHWEPLVRARAIESQAFVIAANQVGRHANGTESYGHSAIVDPWGAILAEGGPDGEDVVVADLDFGALAAVRERLPALAHRRPDVYGEPGPGRF